MSAVTLKSNKAKIARRVIEVFEFFGGGRQRATVMDVARCYGWPQSSTSELLASLAEIGLLYKDPTSRTFTPTPRLAALGDFAQPDLIRKGRLFDYMDSLSISTRKTIALFGMVGTHIQAFRWLPAPNLPTRSLGSGSSELLSNSAAGLLLLSTVEPERARGMLWRLNAEAGVEAKFDQTEKLEHMKLFRRQGYATGEAGFIANAQVTAVLLPRSGPERPLALGIVYPAEESCDVDALVKLLRQGLDELTDTMGEPAHKASCGAI